MKTLSLSNILAMCLLLSVISFLHLNELVDNNISQFLTVVYFFLNKTYCKKGLYYESKRAKNQRRS
jgi:hypothetical protein